MASTIGGAAFGQYDNPFRDADVTGERVDMGADFQGRAGDPVYALGPGVIVAAGDQWRGAAGAPVPGTWIAERLTEGPLAGRLIYTAEDIVPAVSVGQRVTARDVIGRFTGAGQLETGFAAPPGTTGLTAAAAAGQYTADGVQTAFGKEIRQVLDELGAPRPGAAGAPVGGRRGGQLSGCVPAAGVLVLGCAGGLLELGHVAGLW